MSVLESFDEAVDKAIAAGNLDGIAHGAAIEAARKVASMMDDPDWPMVNGKLDNVSPGVFLKYCSALGLLPNETAKEPKQADKPSVTATLGNSKWRKTANG